MTAIFFKSSIFYLAIPIGPYMTIPPGVIENFKYWVDKSDCITPLEEKNTILDIKDILELRISFDFITDIRYLLHSLLPQFQQDYRQCYNQDFVKFA